MAPAATSRGYAAALAATPSNGAQAVRCRCQRGQSQKPASQKLFITRYTEHRKDRLQRFLSYSAFSGDGASGDQQMTERRRYLLKYVQDVQPQVMEQFADKAHPQVVDAMRQTVTNMLGTLPPQFFQVTISTVGENLAQLMYSVMMSGYMFRNAQYRMDLRNGLATLLPGGFEEDQQLRLAGQQENNNQYADGVQKKEISGEVVRWNFKNGAEVLGANEYIDMLEREVNMLKAQVAARQRLDEGNNDLIEYLKSLEPHNLQELTANAGEDVLDAMNSFIQRLLGSSDPDELKSTHNESTAVELARMLYWLMVVGYSLRTIEVRYDMEQSMDLPPLDRQIELPPGA